jgi:hypothetical protein
MSHRHVRRNVVHSSTEPCPWPDECVEHLRCGGCGSLLAGIDECKVCGVMTQEQPPEPSLVDKVIEFAEKLEGVELQPWQERMMRAIFSGHGVVPTVNFRRRY